ncbi:MAG: DDE-type integrase/transposase/recombinase [Crocinitomicaceae bacterium]|nr:DDE-type integrase/transposase/recombinase [Crocinitomicaceae bacterium]
MKTKKRKFYSPEKKRNVVASFIESGLTAKDYSNQIGIAAVTLSRWARDFGHSSTQRTGHYTPEQRRFAINEFMKSGLTQKNFAKIWNVDQKTLSTWLNAYKKDGPKGLEGGTLYGSGKKQGRKELNVLYKNEIIKTSERLPTFGLKKLQNFLFRFEGIKVATNTIKKVLKEAEVYEPKKEVKRRHSPPVIRRFERAKPMQMWQTDITSYVLPRSKQRVYLVVFLDDNSRYIISWSLALKQTGAYVMECLMAGIDKFGKPEEILSDQGRQYFSWRGKSEFQKLLHQEGIQHVVSRSHHPQTLGKCERFWKTVGLEFWDRVGPQDLEEARARFSHFVNHYNHFRPHQGIEGMVPADRFFELSDEIRESIEKTFSQNELRVALDKSPRKPFFFVGQIGDKKISMHGERGEVVIQTPEGEYERINYDEFGKRDDRRKSLDRKEDKEENKKKQSEEREIQDASSSDTCQRTMGVSEQRREGLSSNTSDSDNRILDGTQVEGRDGGGSWSETATGMANEPTSRDGDVCSSFEATEDEERYDCEGRRSEIFDEEDQRIGGDNNYAGPSDYDTEGDARMSRSWRENEEENSQEDGSETWQEAEDITDNLNRESENGWYKKDEE